MFPSLSLLFYLLCIAAVHMLRFIYYGWFLPYLELVLLVAPLLILLLSLPSMLSARLRVTCPTLSSSAEAVICGLLSVPVFPLH